MRNYKNLNEQITRIKSLFGDNRIHGNLIDEGIESSKPLLSEQGWKKRLLNQLKGVDVGSNVYKNIRKSLSSVDDIVSTKFLNYQVRNIGDMVRYIDEFESIWKASLGEQGFKRFKQTMDTLNDPVYVKKINDIFDASPEKGKDLYAMMRNNIPIETHDILDEMFPAALANKNLDDVVGDASSVVVIKKGENTTVHTIDNNGQVIKSSDIDGEGNLVKPDPETTVKSQEDVDNRLNRGDGGKVDGDGGKVDGDGGKVDGDGGKLEPDKGTTTTTDPVNPNTNPDVVNGQILEAIDVGVGKAQGMVKQNVTIPQLQKHMKENGGVLFIKEGDSLVPISNIDEWEVITMKKIDPLDNVEKEFVVSINKKGTSTDLDPKGTKGGDGGGSNGAGPNKSKWKQWWEKQKTSGNREVGRPKGVFDYFRYFFPQTSFLVHKLIWVSRNSKKNLGLYKKPRWSVLNLKSGDKGSWLDLGPKGLMKTTIRSSENTIRLVTEQAFYGYVIGMGMDAYRGGDVRVNPAPHWQTWFDKDNDLLIFTSLPIYGTFKTVEYVLTSYVLFDGLREECRKKWEKQVGADKVLQDSRYKECVAEVTGMELEISIWQENLGNFKETVEKINDMSKWTPEEKKNFCNGEEVNGVTKEGLIEKLNELKAGQQKIRDFIKRKKSEVVGENDGGLGQRVIDFITKKGLDRVKEWVGKAPEDLQSLLLSYKDEEGNTKQFDNVGIDALIQKIGDVCINLNQSNQQVISDPNQNINNTGEEGNNEESGEGCLCPDGSYSTECCNKKLASTDEIQFQVNIIPINIV